MSDECDGKSAGSGASGIHGYGICKSATLVAQLDVDSRRYSEWGKKIHNRIRARGRGHNTKMHTSKELKNIWIENKQPQTQTQQLESKTNVRQQFIASRLSKEFFCVKISEFSVWQIKLAALESPDSHFLIIYDRNSLSRCVVRPPTDDGEFEKFGAIIPSEPNNAIGFSAIAHFVFAIEWKTIASIISAEPLAPRKIQRTALIAPIFDYFHNCGIIVWSNEWPQWPDFCSISFC